MGAEQWLRSETGQLWLTFRRGTELLDEELDRRLRARAGISSAEFEVLARLVQAPGHRLRMGVLAAQVVSSKASLNYRVRQLEERGLLTREQDADDGRVLHASMTDEGLATLERAAPVMTGGIDELFADRLVGDDPERLRTMMGAIVTGLE